MDEGLPFVRGFNVRPGVITQEDLARISPEGNEAHSKSVLRDGDVLVVRTGQAGAASVVPDWAVEETGVDVLIVRCGSQLRPKFLEVVLNSEVAARQIETLTVGAIQSHFNVSALSDLVVPLPSLDGQDRVIALVEEWHAPLLDLKALGTRQVRLLEARREALIAAAVRGEIDVSARIARAVRGMTLPSSSQACRCRRSPTSGQRRRAPEVREESTDRAAGRGDSRHDRRAIDRPGRADFGPEWSSMKIAAARGTMRAHACGRSVGGPERQAVCGIGIWIRRRTSTSYRREIDEDPTAAFWGSPMVVGRGKK